MIDNQEFSIRVYWVLHGMDRAQSIKEINDTLYSAFEDFTEDDIHPQRTRSLLRTWVKRGWCYELTIDGKQGYFYILSGKGTQYISGVVIDDGKKMKLVIGDDQQ